MRKITISRYPEGSPDYQGSVEGTTDTGQSWIIFLDDQGQPSTYWPTRDESGGVVGEPVML